MPEIWRPVKASRLLSYPGGVFEGSSLGRVRVLGEVRDGSPDKDGYLRVKYRGRWWYVAVIVALAWHGSPEARHLNDVRQDNKPGNLAWGSRKDNERDKRENRRKENISHRPRPARNCPKTVTLAEAVELGISRRRLVTLQRASTRSPDFPAPVFPKRRGAAAKYDAVELTAHEEFYGD